MYTGAVKWNFKCRRGRSGGRQSEEIGLVIQIARAEKVGVEGRKSVIFASDVIGWGEASENWGYVGAE